MTTLTFEDKAILFIEGQPSEEKIANFLNLNKELLKPFDHLFGFEVTEYFTEIDNGSKGLIRVMEVINNEIENFVILDINRVKTTKI